MAILKGGTYVGGDLTVATRVYTTDMVISSGATIGKYWKCVDASGSGQWTNLYRYIEVRLYSSLSNVAVNTTIGGDFRIPRACTVIAVGAYVDTAGSTNLTTIDINENGGTILSTKITIDSGEKTSETAATPPVISDAAIAADSILTFDVDGVSDTPPVGLTVWLEVLI